MLSEACNGNVPSAIEIIVFKQRFYISNAKYIYFMIFRLISNSKEVIGWLVWEMVWLPKVKSIILL